MKELGINCPYKGIIIIVLCSKWCISCKLFASILEKLRDKGLIMFKEIDIDENRDLIREFNIIAVPTLLFFKNGNLLNKNIEINEVELPKIGYGEGSFIVMKAIK